MTDATPGPTRRVLRLLSFRLGAVVLALLLAACGSTPKRGGGFYQDDGPPDRAPSDLGETADAVPKVEPLNPRANRPYVALGRSYTPLTGDVPFRQKGTASWYGKQFHGNRTASGELYDMFAMTAAHPTLPIPSYARVTNPRNGKSVIVRVNDRGPFKDDRVIDLSYGAAMKLGLVGAGTGEVEIERLTFTQIASGEWRRGTPVARDGSPTAASNGSPAATSASTAEVTLASSSAAAAAALPAPALASPPASAAPRWSVQVGAFSQQANAEALAARVMVVLGFSEGELAPNQRDARVERDENVFRVLVGTLPDQAAAQSLAQRLERLLGRPAMPLPR